MSFASYKTAFRTSINQAPKNEYKVPDVFEVSGSQFFNPQVPLKRFTDIEPENDYYPHKETFGNVQQQFPQEFYDADMKARTYKQLPQFEEQPIQEQPKITCSDIIDHVRKCEVCMKSLEFEFKNSNDYPFDIPEHVVNAIIYVITGIFILFLLDIFVKLGKLIR